MNQRPFAIVTGASTGIGLELAHLLAEHHHDLVIVADEPAINTARDELLRHSVDVIAVEADLAISEGIDRLLIACQQRPIDVLCANAATGLGGAFMAQPFDRVRHTIDTNITGTIDLVQRVVRGMLDRQQGRVLIVGSVAGYMPGAFQAVYNGTKAFIDSFSFALREELRDSNVTITCLMPGATETEFFRRADMLETPVGRSKKDDPADVAEDGFRALMRGDSHIVSGWKNKVITAFAEWLPATTIAKRHRAMAEPDGRRV